MSGGRQCSAASCGYPALQGRRRRWPARGRSPGRAGRGAGDDGAAAEPAFEVVLRHRQHRRRQRRRALATRSRIVAPARVGRTVRAGSGRRSRRRPAASARAGRAGRSCPVRRGSLRRRRASSGETLTSSMDETRERTSVRNDSVAASDQTNPVFALSTAARHAVPATNETGRRPARANGHRLGRAAQAAGGGRQPSTLEPAIPATPAPRPVLSGLAPVRAGRTLPALPPMAARHATHRGPARADPP